MSEDETAEEAAAKGGGDTAGQPQLAAPEAGQSPGLTAIIDAVTFTNSQVLDPPSASDLDMGAKTLADQAAAMMIQDMRTYLQSIEMVMVPATAEAIALILAGNPNGETALTAIEKFMGTLPGYATGIATAAGSVTTDFE